MAAVVTSTLDKKEDGSMDLKVTLPWEMVDQSWDQVIEKTVEKAKMPGFRPGKAPKKLVEETADKQKVREEVLRQLLPQAYIQAVQEHNLKPIVNPKIHVNSVEDEKDWVFTATTCEMPEIKLGDYKKKVQDITAKSKIVIPGKEQQEPNLDEIIKTILETVEIKIPDLLVDYEVDRLLSQTLDEIKRLGLTLDQYLSSTGKNPEALRDEFKEKAINDMKVEFALQQIAEVENITVEPKEIEEAIQKAQSEQERQHLEANKYLLTSILRQQKTLDFLRNL